MIQTLYHTTLADVNSTDVSACHLHFHQLNKKALFCFMLNVEIRTRSQVNLNKQSNVREIRVELKRVSNFIMS